MHFRTQDHCVRTGSQAFRCSCRVRHKRGLSTITDIHTGDLATWRVNESVSAGSNRRTSICCSSQILSICRRHPASALPSPLLQFCSQMMFGTESQHTYRQALLAKRAGSRRISMSGTPNCRAVLEPHQPSGATSVDRLQIGMYLYESCALTPRGQTDCRKNQRTQLYGHTMTVGIELRWVPAS